LPTSRPVSHPPRLQSVSMQIRKPRSKIIPSVCGVCPTTTVLPESCGLRSPVSMGSQRS
jgi:hypothetical protein